MYITQLPVRWLFPITIVFAGHEYLGWLESVEHDVGWFARVRTTCMACRLLPVSLLRSDRPLPVPMPSIIFQRLPPIHLVLVHAPCDPLSKRNPAKSSFRKARASFSPFSPNSSNHQQSWPLFIDVKNSYKRVPENMVCLLGPMDQRLISAITKDFLSLV